MKNSSPLKHHFADLKQQYFAANLGMWLFLVTEILFFGGIFLGYALYRGMYPEAFALASAKLSMPLGAFNTVVLISSSFTMVLAVSAAQGGHKKETIRNLFLTIALGFVFLIVKFFEYRAKFAHHLVPGKHFEFHGHSGFGAEIFYSFYFGMTGLHALHMIIGMIILGILVYQAGKGRFTREYNTPVDMTGLYWHFVDIVWIFLFPLLYLI